MRIGRIQTDFNYIVDLDDPKMMLRAKEFILQDMKSRDVYFETQYLDSSYTELDIISELREV